jgi:hypothetical protein
MNCITSSSREWTIRWRRRPWFISTSCAFTGTPARWARAPDARIHYEFDATIHDEVPVGERLTVVGKVTDRYTKRGRDYVVMEIDLRAKSDNRLLVLYRDTAILAYRTTGADDDKAGAA